jgi:hypothetical protein
MEFTLVNIVIANPTWAYLLPQSCAAQGFVVFDAVQAKERNYHDQHPIDQFLLSIIEVFRCLDKHVNVFLHDCVNYHLELKRAIIPSSFCLCYFSSLKNFNYIAKDAIILHLKSCGDCRLSYFLTSTLSRHTPITMANLLHVVGYWDKVILTSSLC